jgi:biopolymer transport protein ExbD
MESKHIPDDDIISGINITPLVDIMLVLLFIFMLVTTFVDMNGIPIDLPRAETGEPLNTRTVSVMIDRKSVV